MAYLMLALAILAEVTATLALRGSHGMSRMAPAVVVVVGYLVSFALMAHALRTLNVGPVYAIWSGIGTVGVFAGGVLLFREPLRITTMIGAAIVIAGVIVMNLGGGAGRA